MVRSVPDPDWALRLRLRRTVPSSADLDDPVRGLAVTGAWTAGALLLGTLAVLRRDHGT
ncbi:hypothetical protein GCM10027087_14550 [Paractinoplanes abujensis]